MPGAADERFVSFYARTAAPISQPEGQHWMLLFIDADRSHTTGWEGYDFLVNHGPAGENFTAVASSVGNAWAWKRVASVPLQRSGAELESQIPRALLGLTGRRFAFDFKWADAIQKDESAAEFTLKGDSAPNDRYRYRFTVTLPEGSDSL